MSTDVRSSSAEDWVRFSFLFLSGRYELSFTLILRKHLKKNLDTSPQAFLILSLQSCSKFHSRRVFHNRVMELFHNCRRYSFCCLLINIFDQLTTSTPNILSFTGFHHGFNATVQQNLCKTICIFLTYPLVR